jgi:DeoR family fructose operon transcriptional repressor
MLKNERQNHIMKHLQEKQFCTVNFLAKRLYVAPITIRRDLAELEQAGYLLRRHGGAALPDSKNQVIPYELRAQTNASVKAALAKQAAALLKDGDTVFMDASTTVRHIIDYLTSEQNLTVITNNIKALEELREKHIRCYLTGGMLLENTYALVGSIAERSVSELYVDICFFSTQGITQDWMITDFSEEETRLRQKMLEHAKRRVYLFDSSKIGKQYLFKVCDRSSIDDFITDGDMPNQ